ncbi:uncharacterized protein BO72DRAFT_503011 [Aspergillus fijiensis CBS 313.89]|uniref:Uncharacterized protein n=1 Tax=Aspergillus fijiensis CBS 313.89 TaxID=1448319 RepID=A0A8G1W1Y2_9EURO|nr:uncharacterized protein BO72DRAFT_503011 [Aspergillus fijiensis CBS 313.89]RAK80148.1 hypothetical protein BO72DRAFT_503011 [Aspergillus fijiensis CBS 313.89]
MDQSRFIVTTLERAGIPYCVFGWPVADSFGMSHTIVDLIARQSLDFAGFVIPDRYIPNAYAALRNRGAHPCTLGRDCVSVIGFLNPPTDIVHWHTPNEEAMIRTGAWPRLTVRIYRKSMYMWFFADPPLNPRPDDLYYMWSDQVRTGRRHHHRQGTGFVMPTPACWTEALVVLHARDFDEKDRYMLTRLWHRELLRVCMQLLQPMRQGGHPLLLEGELDLHLVGVIKAMRAALIAGDPDAHSDLVEAEIRIVRAQLQNDEPPCPPPQGVTYDHEAEVAWWKEWVADRRSNDAGGDDHIVGSRVEELSDDHDDDDDEEDEDDEDDELSEVE